MEDIKNISENIENVISFLSGLNDESFNKVLEQVTINRKPKTEADLLKSKEEINQNLNMINTEHMGGYTDGGVLYFLCHYLYENRQNDGYNDLKTKIFQDFGNNPNGSEIYKYMLKTFDVIMERAEKNKNSKNAALSCALDVALKHEIKSEQDKLQVLYRFFGGSRSTIALKEITMEFPYPGVILKFLEQEDYKKFNHNWQVRTLSGYKEKEDENLSENDLLILRKQRRIDAVKKDLSLWK